MTARLVVLVGYDGVQGLDLTGPLDVFAGARDWVERTGSPDPGYRTMVASVDGKAFRTTAGMSVMPDAALNDLPAPIDTLVVAGGSAALDIATDETITGWLRSDAARARRVCSVCSGAFLLAEAGLLDGRRATTHWSVCERLAARYPTIDVDRDPIYVRDGDVYTSAGVTAGMDLALALVELDLGRRAALTIARWLVMFLHRPGNQAQFSTQLTTQYADHHRLRELQHWLDDNYDATLTVDSMASRVRMSPRHFARSFQRQVGLTPGRYLQQLRLDAVGPYEALSRMPGARVRFVASSTGLKRADEGLGLYADTSLAELPHPDIILVPGSSDPSGPLTDPLTLGWLRDAYTRARWTTSVCSGSLILAAAGILTGRRATTHWIAMDNLGALGAIPVPQRIVVDGRIVTAAGVSAGIDLSLRLAALIHGADVARALQLAIEYDPEPPFAVSAYTATQEQRDRAARLIGGAVTAG